MAQGQVGIRTKGRCGGNKECPSGSPRKCEGNRSIHLTHQRGFMRRCAVDNLREGDELARETLSSQAQLCEKGMHAEHVEEQQVTLPHVR